MDRSSRLKVISAGFIVLRKDDQPTFRIKCQRVGSHNWETWQNFPSPEIRDKRLIELLREPNFIED